MSNKKTTITKDAGNRKIVVAREFEAPVEVVWRAWPDKDILDQWWTPKPWKGKTKTMDFREGSTRLYSMVAPDGTDAWCRVDFKTTTPNQAFTADDAFCDENGNITNDLPGMHWKNVFSSTGS